MTYLHNSMHSRHCTLLLFWGCGARMLCQGGLLLVQNIQEQLAAMRH